MKDWIRYILVDIAVFSLLIYGGYYNVEWAYNIIIFFIWFCNVIAIMALLIPKEQLKEVIKEKSIICRRYHLITDIAMVAIMLSLGWFWITSFRVIGLMISSSQYARIHNE